MLEAVRAPRRQRMLRLVWDAELRAGDLAARMPEVSFAAVSQHLRVLREAGAVTVRRDGRERWYRADRGALGPLGAWLESLWAPSLQRLARLAEAAQSDAKERSR